MNVADAIKKRYSCRSYSDKKVPRETILELLELANRAPSAGNRQNRQFIVITDAANRRWLKDMNNQPQLGEAPVVILVTARLDKQTAKEYLKGLEEWEMTVAGVKPSEVDITDRFKGELREMRYKWMISDAAAAVQNLMLAATEKDLATCWVGIMDFEGVVEKFGLSDDQVPICLVTLGYPKAPPKSQKDRKDIGELVHWGRYSN